MSSHQEKTLLTFVGAALSLMATYVASAAPIPLYGLYRAEDGLSYVDLSLSSVVYFIGAVTALLIFGRLSNHLGRRPVSLLALAFAAVASIAFLNVHSVGPLLVGRLLQGLSCGLASTALASWLVDASDAVPSWVAPAVISCGPMTGLTLGGVGSGVLVEYGPIPRQIPFLVVLGLLLLCALLITRGRETMTRQPGVIRSFKPHFALPPAAREAYLVAACTFVCTWALGGFFQAFGPAMAREQLHSTSAVAAALVFASIMAPSVLGASIAGRFRPVQVQRFGMLFFVLAIIGLLFSLSAGWLVSFLGASVLAGIAQGAILSGSIQSMVSTLTMGERANVFSVIYVTSYSGAAIPTLIAGQLSETFNLLQVACGYGVLALTGCCFVWWATRSRQIVRRETSHVDQA